MLQTQTSEQPLNGRDKIKILILPSDRTGVG